MMVCRGFFVVLIGLRSLFCPEIRKQDAEKGEEFDLQDYFEDSVRRGEKKGHQLKRMGGMKTRVVCLSC